MTLGVVTACAVTIELGKRVCVLIHSPRPGVRVRRSVNAAADVPVGFDVLSHDTIVGEAITPRAVAPMRRRPDRHGDAVTEVVDVVAAFGCVSEMIRVRGAASRSMNRSGDVGSIAVVGRSRRSPAGRGLPSGFSSIQRGQPVLGCHHVGHLAVGGSTPTRDAPLLGEPISAGGRHTRLVRTVKAPTPKCTGRCRSRSRL